MRPLNPLDGEILVIDKPLGWSSFHAVKKVRNAMLARLRRVGIRDLKVGHAGTLDPLATGVVIICTGKATKDIERIQSGVKEYIATIGLGATTPSFDLETDIDATYPTDHITRELLDSVLPRFMGRIEQIPPAYSAVKVDGKRAYDMARAGQEVELKPKILVIDELEVLEFSPTSITLRVVCSKGTYIRALARDIGQALGSGGHLTALRRTRVGDYRVGSGISPDEAARVICGVAMVAPDVYGYLMPVPRVVERSDSELPDEAPGARGPRRQANILSYAERQAEANGEPRPRAADKPAADKPAAEKPAADQLYRPAPGVVMRSRRKRPGAAGTPGATGTPA